MTTLWPCINAVSFVLW